MIKTRKRTIIFTLLICISFLLIANFSQAKLITCGVHNPDGSVTECGIGDLIQTIRLIINFLLSWAWLVAILMIVVSGFRMVFARGDSEAISKAKTSLNNAIIGFILILVSFVILNLVIGLLTGGGQLNPGSLIDAFNLVP